MRKEYQFLDEKIVPKSRWQSAINELEGEGSIVIATFVNPFSYSILQSRPELVEQFNYIFSDGILHTKLHNLFCDNKIDRVSFDLSSIAKDTLLRAENKGLRVAFIGGKPEHAAVLEQKMKELFPQLQVCICRDGYFDNDEQKSQAVDEIMLAKPDIVIVGMGTPLQEEFLLKCVAKNTSANEFYTCGGFLEQTATKGDYYHPLVKKLGIRWLQRAILHSHVRKRIFKDYPKFVLNYIKSHL
ncbi:WecB/TagA/CpsF family glycosyltransferase [Pseudoalteromonas viridis]|uniref:WecB/TagA/CpsF family glycosyltransferase n=1 Tax=Pseudoalteromonas viridis TaxID=339617 RepID=A0ABX7V6L8_9GAMM|nr:WecB/TagA/CpsF family glycosyltransferase [Pseudoalteromonas viridis]QTL36100.1 WecB/TagA/CpsF family glycosyltransferase [Pseudoalteromonas viridis]